VLAQNARFFDIANHLRYAKCQFVSLVKPAVSFCLLAVVLLQLSMAVCEPLHKFFHPDADEAGHECAVTMFAHGQVENSVVDVPVILPSSGIELTPQIVFSHFVSTVKDLPPGRAPPLPRLVS
jgi:hypothetical protein